MFTKRISLSLFLLTSLNANSEPITLFSINSGMPIKERVEVLSKQGFECGPATLYAKGLQERLFFLSLAQNGQAENLVECGVGYRSIVFNSKIMIFNCASYSGCSYPIITQAEFVSNQPTIPELIPMEDGTFCGSGTEGDSICLDTEMLVIHRGSLGASQMTFTIPKAEIDAQKTMLAERKEAAKRQAEKSRIAKEQARALAEEENEKRAKAAAEERAIQEKKNLEAKRAEENSMWLRQQGIANAFALDRAVQSVNEAGGSEKPELRPQAKKAPLSVDVIKSRLEMAWRLPPSTRSGMESILDIYIDRDGSISKAEVVKSSGDRAFDASAMQASYRVGRFAEIEEVESSEYEEKFQKVRISFKPQGIRW